MARTIPALIGILLLLGAVQAEAQSLRGSPAKMQRQNAVAREHDYTFIRTTAQVRRFVDLGLLVPLRGNANYSLATVSFPYARPAVRTFVERLAAQFRNACGEKLVITSLTRPLANQPRNASPLSVHPAGMAVDLRVPRTAACRRWLDNTLLQLDRGGVISATRENRPPHYHVAVFPTPYLRYVQRLTGSAPALATRTGSTPARAAETDDTPARAVEETDDTPARAAEETDDTPALGGVSVASASVVGSAGGSAPVLIHRVRRGDTLWAIARRYDTTIEELKELNGLNSARILAGQRLSVPAP
jgi:LysM repeat protein